MDWSDTQEQAAFRAEVRAVIDEHLPARYREQAEHAHAGERVWEFDRKSGDPAAVAAAEAWGAALSARGWVAPHWPREYGGAGLSPMEQFVFNQEMAEAGAPTVGGSGVSLLGPTLIIHGTDEQKAEHLPRILSGEVAWAQGYSEPAAGSDLASLQTRATRDGDEYVINGQKIWTSGAHTADAIFALVRTDPEAPKHRGISFLMMDIKTPGKRRDGNFILSPLGLVDLLAVLPFWFAFALPADLRVLLVFRIVRFLKLARYSPAMRSLLDAIYRERRALFGCFVILLGATLLAASVMHLIERHAQPDKFGTIPDAMWWAIVTLGTIGYGDVVPITLLGRIVASVTIFVGLIMVALPIGIVATAFADEIHRRDFIVTWSMVARVPLFAGLQASDIADIMRLLRAQQVEPGVVIARRGDPAHSMYFVAAGEVEIELKREHIRLGAGHFFGEVAALPRARRSGTVTAVTRTSLLVLDAHDLHALMDREPRIAERIREVVRSRIGRDIVTTKGDLVSEELEETLYPTAVTITVSSTKNPVFFASASKNFCFSARPASIRVWLGSRFRKTRC